MAKLVRNKEIVQIDSNLLKFLKYGELVKPIPNYPNYFASSYGRIFSGKYKIEYECISKEKYHCIIWKELRPRLTNGYLSVNITNDYGVRKREYVHYLIYETFEGWIDRSVLKIVHRDKCKTNNHISNLAVDFRKKTDYQAHKNYAYRENLRRNL